MWLRLLRHQLPHLGYIPDAYSTPEIRKLYINSAQLHWSVPVFEAVRTAAPERAGTPHVYAPSRYDRFVKMILVGSVRAGKSCFYLRFVNGTYSADDQTRAPLFTVRACAYKRELVKLEVWDCFRKYNYRDGYVISAQYRNAHITLCMFDISDRTSFENVREHARYNRKYAPHYNVMLLVGCKSDLACSREVDPEDARALTAEFGSQSYVECSALTDVGVDEVCAHAVEEFFEHGAPRLEEEKNRGFPVPPRPKKRCALM